MIIKSLQSNIERFKKNTYMEASAHGDTKLNAYYIILHTGK